MLRRLAAAAFTAALLVPALWATQAQASRAVARTRALTSYAAMQRYLVDPQTRGYLEVVGTKTPAHAWPFSQALAAAIAVARLPSARADADVPVRVRALEQRFRVGPVYAAWPGGDVYIDDNEWIAGAFLDWNVLHSNPSARARAAALFAAATRSWDATARDPCTGGIYWTQSAANRDRNTVTTANAALLGLRLYALTHAAGYLSWSRRLLAWVDSCMLDPDGLYRDHIAGDGTVDGTQWSYNQGLVLGAYTELYAVTGDASALTRAESLGDTALAYFAGRWSNGEPPEFAAIFFRQLLGLAVVDGRTDYVAAAAAYGDRAWAARDRTTGLFSSGGPTRLLDQAAFVQLYAALATAGP